MRYNQQKKRCGRHYLWLFVLFVFVSGTAAFFIRNRIIEEQNSIHYGPYTIRFEFNEYSEETRCGRIDLRIKHERNSQEKLFSTNDDVTGSGNKKIVDLNTGLRVYRDGVLAESYIQEISFQNNQQHIAVKYINLAEEQEEKCAQIQIVKPPSEEVLSKFSTPFDTETEAIVLKSYTSKGMITASNHGMKVGLRGGSVDELKVYYKNDKVNTLLLRDSVDKLLGETYRTNYVQVSHKFENDNNWYYGWDFGEIGNIKSIKVNDSFYYPQDEKDAKSIWIQ